MGVIFFGEGQKTGFNLEYGWPLPERGTSKWSCAKRSASDPELNK